MSFAGHARGTARRLQAPGVIRMCVRENNCVRMQPLKFSQPIEATINHNLGATIGDEERTMHAMPPGPRFDLAAGAEKGEPH